MESSRKATLIIKANIFVFTQNLSHWVDLSFRAYPTFAGCNIMECFAASFQIHLKLELQIELTLDLWVEL